MLLTRDLQVDWNSVPDIGQKLPSGVVQFKISAYEERMTSAEGLKKDGSAKVAKYMIVCRLEGMAPEEAIGASREEFFVLGSDEDPLMQAAKTFYDSIGARSLKRMLGDAQVPWSASLVATLNSSIGAMFCAQVNHKMEKRSDTGEMFVGVRLGTTFKVGERVPQYVPCALAECLMCQSARGTGTGASPAPMSAPAVYAGPNYPNPPAVTHTQAPPLPPKPPVAPPAPPVPPVQTAPVPPVNTPPTTQASAEVVAAAAGPPPTMTCRICGTMGLSSVEYPLHVAACAQNAATQAQAAFKQEA